jgi:U3 small nucleolar RNA-associated protein 5
MTGRRRGADGSLSDPRATKKARPSTAQPHDLKSALFANGAPRKLKAHVSQSAHNNIQSHRIDDTKAVISKSLGHGNIPTPHIDPSPVIEISSDSSSSSDDDEEEEDDTDDDADAKGKTVLPNGTSHDLPSPAASKQDSDKENVVDTTNAEDTEPSFGDLLAASTADPIDVESLLTPSASTHNQHHRTLVPPTSATLATVLEQALRTNDSSLLESCLLLNDLSAVRGTIERLPSDQVEALLDTLAARIYARPGRANSLMVWLQWTFVAHGGYVAGRQGPVAKLGSLQRALRERAAGLAPLLALKGKLDMLSAQVELRRLVGRQIEDDDEDGVVVYVEDDEDEEKGEDDESEDEAVLGVDEQPPEEMDSDEDSSSDEDSDDESDASSQGFSDQGFDQEAESDSDDDEDTLPATKIETRKGR